MDNECPKALEAIIVHTNKNTLQLVITNTHQTNPVERAIKTFKVHLIAGLSSIDPFSPFTFGAVSSPRQRKT